MSFKIIGTGSALPKKVITNDDLSKILDTNDEWITTRTGIKERRILSDESLSDIAVEASGKAVENSGININEIDTVICVTLHGEYVSPSMACVIAGELGLNCKHMFDLNMACNGFIYALDVADSYIKAGKAENILIVAAEAMSRLVDWEDRATCVLFGDASSAAVLTKGDSLIDMKLTLKPNIEHLYVERIIDNSPYVSERPEKSSLHMNGQEIYKLAVTSICADIGEILEKNKCQIDSVKYFLLHQANIRIIMSAVAKLKQPKEKFYCNIQKYGNTSSVSIPLLIDELNRKNMLSDGDLIVMSAFGAGFAAGCCLLKW